MYVCTVIHFTHVTGSSYLAFWSNCQFLQERVDDLWTVESYLDNGLMCFSPTRGLDGYGSGPPCSPSLCVAAVSSRILSRISFFMSELPSTQFSK